MLGTDPSKLGDARFDRAVIRRVWRFARPYRWLLGGFVLILGLQALVDIVPPLLFRDIIDRAIPEGRGGDLTLLHVLSALAVAAVVSGAALSLFERWMSSRIGEGVIYDLRVAVFDHIQQMPLAFFTRTQTGALTSRLNNDVVGAQRALTQTLGSVVSNLIVLGTTVTVMVTLEWRLTLLALAALPLFIFPAKRVGRRLQAITREQMNLNAEMSATMTERFNVAGALLVKLFGRPSDEHEEFARRADGVRVTGIKAAMYGRTFFIALGLVGAVATAAVYWIGGMLVVDGNISIGTLIALAALVTRIYGPLTQLTNARVDLMSAVVSFERVFEVLDAPNPIADKRDAVDLDDVVGLIELDDVWFRYPTEPLVPTLELDPTVAAPSSPLRRTSSGSPNVAGAAGSVGVADSAGSAGPDDAGDSGGAAGAAGAVRPATPGNAAGSAGRADVAGVAAAAGAAGSVESDGAAGDGDEAEYVLQGVSAVIEPGQLVALVGPSGAGKTTLASLVPRLYDVTEGAVRVDGLDVRDVTQASLRRAIGVVSQDPHLFHDTVGNNLRYARPSATQDEVEAACRAAQIHEVIARLPEGYDTIVGERGYRLSGGEKQRLAIARMLLKDPAVVILDEATSHLDSENEALVQRALAEGMAGRTSLVIAHRLSTIVEADMILVVDEGQIVERGTHHELLLRGGLYAELYRTLVRDDLVDRRAGDGDVAGDGADHLTVLGRARPLPWGEGEGTSEGEASVR